MVGNKGNEYLDVNDDWCEIDEKHPENGECNIQINAPITDKIAAISMIRKIAEMRFKEMVLDFFTNHFRFFFFCGM